MNQEAIDAAFAKLLEPQPAKFIFPETRFHQTLARKRQTGKPPGIRKLIRPENAAVIIPQLPEPGDRLEILLLGNFVLCDLIPEILNARGKCPHLRVTTLSLSPANGCKLADLYRSGKIERLSLVCSHYFRHTENVEAWQKIKATLLGVTTPIISRMHCKVILIPTDSGDFYTLTGSANLRSAGCLEQLTITNDRESHDFHASWIDALPEDRPE